MAGSGRVRNDGKPATRDFLAPLTNRIPTAMLPLMAMTLAFERPHLSISAFPTTRLPAFTLITGLNGSGKTHLLRAIEKGFIRIEGLTNVDVRYFDWHTLNPGGPQHFRSAQLTEERDKLSVALDRSLEERRIPLLAAAQDAGLPSSFLEDPRAIARLSLDELVSLYDGDDNKARRYLSQFRDLLRSASQAIVSDLQRLQLPIDFDHIERQSGIPLAAHDRDVLLDGLLWGQTDAFSQGFSRLFVAYRNLLLKNELARRRAAKGDPDASPLSDQEFTEKYNVPPWDLLNDLLQEAGLDFEVERPELDDYSGYRLRLRKRTSQQTIDVEYLSSGEKIMMSFANCLYYTQDIRQISKFPSVVLFDEIDAPLHPSMARGLIRIITQSLVRQLDIAVIAATHVASTVAMAPEEAVHVMRAGEPGLHKVSKNQALALLTAGVPTLSINIDGRRQVFVESTIDVQIYETVYQVAKRHLQSERSLTFIAPGAHTKTGDADRGCGAVRRIVNELARLGNRSVFGLNDWDGKNEPSERIRVLAYRKRDGVENCLLDPLLLACMIVRECRGFKERLGIARGEGMFYFKGLDEGQLQQIVDAVEALVLSDGPEGESLNRTETRYAGGTDLMVSQKWMTMDDHLLLEIIMDKIPPLNKYRRPGELVSRVANDILPEFPEFIPMDILDAFSGLLEADR